MIVCAVSSDLLRQSRFVTDSVTERDRGKRLRVRYAGPLPIVVARRAEDVLIALKRIR